MPIWLRSIAVLSATLVWILWPFIQSRAQAHLHNAPETAGRPYSSSAELPSAPAPHLSSEAVSVPLEPAADAKDHWDIAPAGTSHQAPLSRVGIGANVSPLGIGINTTTVLTDFFDARLMGNIFGYTSRQFEAEGFRSTANLHLASMAASLDWYPFNSIWRLSSGIMFYNANRFSMKGLLVAGTDFTMNGQTFYSASTNPATGATPLTGTGVLGFHPRPVAFTLAGGFGKFVPRSNRHWSFPSEFGVVFMGAPTVDVTPSGWVCLDQAQTRCSDISSPTNPVAQQFHTALQAQLAKWRRNLGTVTVYPMFSYSVVYSFNIP